MKIQTAVTCVALSVCAVTLRADRIAFNAKGAKPAVDAQSVQARKAIQAIYDRQASAMERKNINGFLAPFTPDYQNIKYGGHIYTRAHLKQQLPGLIAKYPPGFKFKTTIQRFQLMGQRAKATANYHLELVRTDAVRHKRELWTSDTVSQDEWIKTGANWQLKSSRETQFTKKTTPLTSNQVPQAMKPQTSARTIRKN